MTGAAAPSQPSLEELVQCIAAAPPTYALRRLAQLYRSIAAAGPLPSPGELVALWEQLGHPLPTVRNLVPMDFAVVGVELARAQAGIGRIAPPEGGTDFEFRAWGTMARRALRRHLESRGGRHYDLQQVLLGHRPPPYRGVVPAGAELLAISVMPALWAFDVAGALARDPRMVSFALFAVSVAGRRQQEALDRGSLGQRWDLESLQVAVLDAYGPSRDFSALKSPRLDEALEREAQMSNTRLDEALEREDQTTRPPVSPATVLSEECRAAGYIGLATLLGPMGQLPSNFGGFRPLREDWRRRLRRKVEHDLVTRTRADVGAVELPEALPDPAGSDPLRQVEAREDLRAWIREAKLSPMERQVLQLEFEKDLTTAEMARQLGRSEAAVRLRRHRALAKLRPLM
jgi:DNA-binding CsgD family transcriptional regulator